MKISKRRQEMGEEKWLKYQKERKNRKASVYKKQNPEKVIEWRRRAKIKLIEYKGGKCERCGFSDLCSSCYDFHHRNPEEKEFRIGGMSLSFDRLKAEADKCMLLCRNCHAWIHEQKFAIQRENSITKWKEMKI